MSHKKEVFFACRMPPPFTGQTIATKLIVDLLKDSFGIYCYNISDARRKQKEIGTFSLSYFMRTILFIKNIKQQTRYRKPDVFYFSPAGSYLGFLRDLLLVNIIRKDVTRIVAHVHAGNFADILGKHQQCHMLAKQFVKKIDKFIFLSNSLSHCAKEIISDEKRVVIHNIIDGEVRFSDNEIAQKIEGKRSRKIFNIIFISNMIPEKGYLMLGEALGNLSADVAWQAHFIGRWDSEKQKEEFEAILRKKSVIDSVNIYGIITDRKIIKEILRGADVFVLPTKYISEAQPLSIIEAMNAGTPVITTAHASIPDFVYNDENGYLLTKRTPQKISNAIEKLFDYNNWEKKANAARSTYVEKFDTDIIRKQLLEALLS